MTQHLQWAVRSRATPYVTLARAGLFLAVLGLTSIAPAQEVRYIYDDLNRLVGVVDPEGNAAEYVYDAVGNLREIKRFNVDPNATLAISLVSPTRGTVGTPVELFGQGISPTPGDTQVVFSGTPAPVTEAAPGRFLTAVPEGATTGPITLTAPLGSASSREPFVVLQPVLLSPPTATVWVGGSVPFSVTTPVTWRVNTRDVKRGDVVDLIDLLNRGGRFRSNLPSIPRDQRSRPPTTPTGTWPPSPRRVGPHTRSTIRRLISKPPTPRPTSGSGTWRRPTLTTPTGSSPPSLAPMGRR